MSTDSILKQLLESFKTKSPKLFVVIAFILSVIAYTAQQGELLGIIPLAGIWQKIVVAASWILAIVSGVQSPVTTDEQYKSLETQLALITERYDKLKNEYETLDADNERLTETVSDKEITIQNLVKECSANYARWQAAQNIIDNSKLK